MAVVHVQGVVTATTTATLPANTTPGNFLAVLYCHRGTTVSTGPTSTHGTWQLAVSRVYTGNTEVAELWYLQNLSGTSPTINLPAKNSPAVHAAEYSGVAHGVVFDQSATNEGSTSGTITSGTTPTTLRADELWMAGFTFQNAGRTFSTPTNGFTIRTTNATGHSSCCLDRYVTATGAAQTSVVVSGGNGRWVGLVGTFRAVAIVPLAATVLGTSTITSTMRVLVPMTATIAGASGITSVMLRYRRMASAFSGIAGIVVPGISRTRNMVAQIGAFGSLSGQFDVLSPELVLQSVAQAEVVGGGGEPIDLLGAFPVGVPLRIYVGTTGTILDQQAYSGVPGNGYVCYAKRRDRLRVYLPPLPIGVYRVHAESPTSSATLLNAVTVRAMQYRTSVYALRRLLPGCWIVGPRVSTEEEPQ